MIHQSNNYSDSEEDNVISFSCPSCERDYELPRRYMLHFDDFDFQPIPRLLPQCLHTICHSCLEDSYQRNLLTEDALDKNVGKVICAICRKEEIIKGVKYLPLDISILKQIAIANGTEIMSSCSRCYDSVPSVSWCETCSSALCEFHHQDHKLSVDTSKHAIHTFKEISHQSSLHIQYNFPPVPCPEALLSDCSIYCHTCLHLISPQAMVDKHREHKLENSSECVEGFTLTVNDSLAQTKTKRAELKENINQIQIHLRTLDENEENSLDKITNTFRDIYKQLEDREKDLKTKLNEITDKKRQKLVNQLNDLSELCEDCNNTIKVSEMLLDCTVNQQEGRDAMYLVASTESIEFHSDDLKEIINEKIKNLEIINTDISFNFIEEDYHEIVGIVRTFGAIDYYDDDLKKLESLIDNIEGMKDVSEENKQNEKIDICYNLIISEKSTISIQIRRENKSEKERNEIVPRRGEILGIINIIAEIDRRLLHRHELKSYYELKKDLNHDLPVLSIEKSFLPIESSTLKH